MQRLICFVLFAVIAVVPASEAATGRIAMVIGNSGYRHAPDLLNPVNDAEDIGAAFEQLGFEVTPVIDASFDDMRRALSAFADKSKRSEVAVIYFAGHGIELDRQNYLLPVDARLNSPTDAYFEALPLDHFRTAVSAASRLSLVIVDACRNNPFLERAEVASRSLGRGLSLVEPSGQNRIVAYAAKAGTTADDGEGRNSPYAAALKDALLTPGLEIDKLFRTVRDRVIEKTGGAQEPAHYGSLSAEDFFLLPPETAEEEKIAAISPAPGAQAIDRQFELEFWVSIRNSERIADYEDFIALFPDSKFTPLARRRIAALRVEQADVPEPSVPRIVPGTTAPAAMADAAAPEEEDLAALSPAEATAPAPGTLGGIAAPAGQPRVFAPEPEPADEPAAAETPGTDIAAIDPGAATDAEPREPEPMRLSRERLRRLQVRLNLLGHDAGVPDGLMGANTRSALRSFEESTGRRSTGIPSRGVVEAIEAAVSEARVDAWYAEIEAERRRRAEERRRAQEAAEARRREQARQEAVAAPRAEPQPEPQPATRIETPVAATPAPEPEPEPVVRAAPEPEEEDSGWLAPSTSGFELDEMRGGGGGGGGGGR